MSFKNKFISILTVAFAMVALATVSMAQDDKTTTPAPDKVAKPKMGEDRGDGRGKFEGHGRPEKMGMRGGPMGGFHNLNLTDTQKEQIKTIRESNRPNQATIDQMKAFRESHKADTPPTDEQKAQMKAFREQSRAKAKLVHEQMLNVLTADQKAQFEKGRTEMKQHRKEFRKNRPDKKTAPAASDKPITK